MSKLKRDKICVQCKMLMHLCINVSCHCFLGMDSGASDLCGYVDVWFIQRFSSECLVKFQKYCPSDFRGQK